MSGDETDRLGRLEARVEELEALQQLLVRLMSTTRPLSGVFERWGATETQEQTVYQLLDELCERMRGLERDRPTFAYFEKRLGEIVPAVRGDRQFVQLVIDTLRVERPAYRDLYAYMRDQHWPSWGA